MLAGIALRRAPADRRRLSALAVSTVGLVLALAGAGTGTVDPFGATLGLGASLTYATYILVADRVGARTHPLVLSALVTAGAAATLTALAAATGTLELTFGAAGWLWLALIATVSTVLAVVAFFAGLARVGPATAAILSTAEPVVTIVLAAAVFADMLTPVQLAGAALVLAAAVRTATAVPGRDRRAVVSWLRRLRAGLDEPDVVAVRVAQPEHERRAG